MTRKQWLAAQSCDWQPIWLYPGIGVLVVLVIFLLAFRPPRRETEPAAAESGLKQPCFGLRAGPNSLRRGWSRTTS